MSCCLGADDYDSERGAALYRDEKKQKELHAVNQHGTGDIFDAHLHITNHFGKPTEPIPMLQCLHENKVIGAAICASQYVKKWGERETERPDQVFYDQYPMTCVLYGDFLLHSLFCSDKVAALRKKYDVALMPMMSSFDLTDRNCIDMLQDKHKLAGGWFKGIGQLNFRRGDMTNLIRPRPSLISHTSKDFFQHVETLNVPVVFQSNATSMSTKAYAKGYEYVPEIMELLQTFPKIPFLWVDFGVNARGYYDHDYYYEHTSVVSGLLGRFPNLFCSITATALKHPSIDHMKLVKVVKKYNTRFVVGTTMIGDFSAAKSKQLYVNEISELRRFVKLLKEDDIVNRVTSQNAIDLYTKTSAMIKGEENENIKINCCLRESLQEKLSDDDIKFVELESDNKEDDIRWNIIDCHLHLLDFLHKSSGTESALKAMTNCGVSKAILFGMPCCKKWCKEEPQRPLYYQDDNGECYFYSYADQMVADSWLALEDESRKRFAPMIASFNPTDKHAIDHIRRMYDKYPTLWRGIGEVMCRHDDLSALLQEFEAPVVNHPAMDAVYQFAIEKNLPVLVHHNSDRVADDHSTSEWQYTCEVEEVLNKYPKLKFIWVHAGVSRRVHEREHHSEIDRLLKKYPNLKIDISWVVWEDVICDKDGEPKKEWVDLIERHNEKVFLGSDQVGQFITIDGKNIYKKEILKYYKLLDKLSKTAAENVAYKNAEKEYFDDWQCPLDLARIESIYPCEYLHHKCGKFVQKNQDTF